MPLDFLITVKRIFLWPHQQLLSQQLEQRRKCIPILYIFFYLYLLLNSLFEYTKKRRIVEQLNENKKKTNKMAKLESMCGKRKPLHQEPVLKIKAKKTKIEDFWLKHAMHERETTKKGNFDISDNFI